MSLLIKCTVNQRKKDLICTSVISTILVGYSDTCVHNHHSYSIQHTEHYNEWVELHHNSITSQASFYPSVFSLWTSYLNLLFLQDLLWLLLLFFTLITTHTSPSVALVYCQDEPLEITPPNQASTPEQSKNNARVTETSHGVWPARIFARKVCVLEGEELTLKCSTDGISATRGISQEGSLHMYLWKDGSWISMKPLRETNDIRFIVSNVTLSQTGNYSCFYSKKRLDTVKIEPGNNKLSIHVHRKHVQY